MNKIIITQSDITSLGLKGSEIPILTAIGFEKVEEAARSMDVFALTPSVIVSYQCDSTNIQEILSRLLNKLEVGETTPEIVNGIMSLINKKYPETTSVIKGKCFGPYSNNRKDFIAEVYDIIELLKRLYFLDIENRMIYQYFLVAFSHFVELDHLTILMINDYDPSQVFGLSKEGGYSDTFTKFKFFDCAKQCKEIYQPLFNFLEKLRLSQIRHNKKVLEQALNKYYGDETGQLSNKKAEQLRQLCVLFNNINDQNPVKDGYVKELYGFPALLLGELVSIYSGNVSKAESYASHEKRYPDIANALNNNDYLSVFIRTLTPSNIGHHLSYRERNPIISMLASEIVLEHSTASLLSEISEVDKTANNDCLDPNRYSERIEEIKKNMRFFLLSIDKIEYEQIMWDIIDFWSVGHYTTNQIRKLISILYRDRQYHFQTVGEQDVIVVSSLSARANEAFNASDFETAFFFYRRLCDLVDGKGLKELALDKELIKSRCDECFRKSIVESINQPVASI